MVKDDKKICRYKRPHSSFRMDKLIYLITYITPDVTTILQKYHTSLSLGTDYIYTVRGRRSEVGAAWRLRHSINLLIHAGPASWPRAKQPWPFFIRNNSQIWISHLFTHATFTYICHLTKNLFIIFNLIMRSKRKTFPRNLNHSLNMVIKCKVKSTNMRICVQKQNVEMSIINYLFLTV